MVTPHPPGKVRVQWRRVQKIRAPAGNRTPILQSLLLNLNYDDHLSFHKIQTALYRVADKSLARPTSRCILFDGENTPFDASLVIYTGCPRRNVPNFGRVFLMLKYTDITQNTYIQSWTVTEIMAREVWNFDSCYTLIDYQIHIKTGRNMWFL